MLSQFENGPPQARRGFAEALRSFDAAYMDEVRVLIRGGHELAKLKCEDGTLSLSNMASPGYWPELTPSDVTGLWAQRGLARDCRCPSRSPAVLEITGGEPRMVAHCLSRLAEMEVLARPADPTALAALAEDLLRDCALCYQLFVPLRRETAL